MDEGPSREARPLPPPNQGQFLPETEVSRGGYSNYPPAQPRDPMANISSLGFVAPGHFGGVDPNADGHGKKGPQGQQRKKAAKEKKVQRERDAMDTITQDSLSQDSCDPSMSGQQQFGHDYSMSGDMSNLHLSGLSQDSYDPSISQGPEGFDFKSQDTADVLLQGCSQSQDIANFNFQDEKPSESEIPAEYDLSSQPPIEEFQELELEDSTMVISADEFNLSSQQPGEFEDFDEQPGDFQD